MGCDCQDHNGYKCPSPSNNSQSGERENEESVMCSKEQKKTIH